jgi:hypothetical protein
MKQGHYYNAHPPGVLSYSKVQFAQVGNLLKRTRMEWAWQFCSMLERWKTHFSLMEGVLFFLSDLPKCSRMKRT